MMMLSWLRSGDGFRRVVVAALMCGGLVTALPATPAAADQAAVQVSAGFGHTCAVTASGGVECWGPNWSGQLGDGSTTPSSVPVAVSGLSTAVQVSASVTTDIGYGHSCAVLSSGGVECWGRNDSGQLGNGSTNSSLVPVAVIGITSAVEVSTGHAHSCALLSAGGVRCWGLNDSGQLGDGSIAQNSVPVSVVGISTGSQVSVGHSHSCALLSAGGVECWGNNGHGVLGDGSTIKSSVPVAVIGIASAVEMSAGHAHSCVVLFSGGVKCWGYNSSGQLGDGSIAQSWVPVSVVGVSSAVLVSVSSNHSCAVLSSGGVECWGNNWSGSLGDGSIVESWVPVSVLGVSSAVEVSTGGGYSCAVMASGAVQCWGDNRSGNLGDGSIAESWVPVSVLGVSSAVEVSAGLSHSCAVTGSGGVECWGSNGSGQLGDGSTTDSSMPVSVSGVSSAVSISAGSSHSCAVTASGGVECWGSNGSGQLGDGSTTDSSMPVSVSGVSSAVSISAGFSHSCAVTASGGVECWGTNGSGQLGEGSIGQSWVPVSVVGVSSAVQVSAGRNHSCAVLFSGGIECWGANWSGQLGEGSTNSSSVPVSVSGVSSAVQVSVGAGHSCAVTASGGVKCWGANWFGVLGDGSTTHSSVPVSVSGVSSAVQVSAGANHSCAMTASGGVECWGTNGSGELGDASTTQSSVPVPASVSGSVVGISTGARGSAWGSHSCAVLTLGGVECWGRNVDGQLGDGSVAESLVPIGVVGLGGSVLSTGVVPVTPCVLWNSAAGTGEFGGPVAGGQAVDLQATGTMPASQGGAVLCGVPSGTSGVLVNVVAKSPLRAGNLRVYPTGAVSSGGVVNFSVQTPVLDNSNAVIVPVSASGGLTVEVNAGPTGVGTETTDVVVTVVGYLDDAGLTYQPVAPCAFADSRSGTGGFFGPYVGHESRTMKVTGTFPASQSGGSTDCLVAGSASAVLVNLVAVNSSGSGDIGVRAGGTGDMTTYVNYAGLFPAMNNSNAVVVPVSASGEVDLFSVAGVLNSTEVRAVVLGYFGSGSSRYVPVLPCAAFDSRVNQGATGGFAGPLSGGESRSYSITGAFTSGQGGGNTDCGVPAGATAVLVNVVAVNPLREGNLRVSSSATSPSGGVVNFAALSPAMNNSNAVVVPLSASGTMDVSANGGASGVGLDLADVRGVVLGYFVSPALPA